MNGEMGLATGKEPRAWAADEKVIQADWYEDCLVLMILLSATLPRKEIKKILLKHGYFEPGRCDSTHLILQTLHAVCHQDLRVVEHITKNLDTRFGNTLLKTRCYDEKQLSQEAYSASWKIPYMWACYQHPNKNMRKLGRELAHAVIRKHLWGNANTDQNQNARADSAKLISRINSLRQQLNKANQENQALEIEQRKRQHLRAQVLSADSKRKSQEQKTIKELRTQVTEQKRQNEELAQELATWRSLALSNNGRSSYEADKTSRVGGLCGAAEKQNEIRETETQFNYKGDALLEGRKIAIIGGLERLEPQYRKAIEAMGGKCLFNAGHTKNGGREFRKVVKKSDLVVCITAINSHGAMKVVKKQCKLCRKPFCPLKGTSVSSLKNLLNDYVTQNNIPPLFECSN